MTQIIKPAVEIRQGHRRLFFTSFTVAELSMPDFYEVEKLDAKDESGFQRVLEERRARLLASDIAKARSEKNAFLPTSILLATESEIEYDPMRQEISFNTQPGAGQVCPFAVVDGQHRIVGMRKAVEKDPSLSSFSMTVVIATGLGKLEQMLHFYLVNTKQKAVDKSIEQQIKAKLRRMGDIGEHVFLPDRILRDVQRGCDRAAIDFVQDLNEHPKSPWCGRVVMANEKRGEHSTIQQSTLVKSVQEFLLARGHKLANSNLPIDTRKAMLRNYWSAIGELLVTDVKKSVVFRYTGTVFFHTISQPLFNWLTTSGGDYRIDSIKKRLQAAFEELPEEHYDLSQPHWWERGSEASSMNKGEIARRAGAMMQAIERARETEQGEDEL